MGILKLSTLGILDYQKYSNMLAGNEAFSPASDDFLEEVILTSSASSVTFSGLDAYTDYKHLQIRMITQSDRGAGEDSFGLRFNSDSGSNYSWHRLFGNGSSVISSAATSQTLIYIGNITNSTNVFTGLVLDILDFSSSSKNTTTRNLAGSSSRIGMHSGAYLQTSAITSLEIFSTTSSNITSGSRFSLYGSKG